MIKIDWQSGVPIYDQIVSGFIRLRAIGALQAGDKLPSVRSMAVKLGVNPNTVQKAYIILENKGITYSLQGKGSFLADGDDAGNAINDECITALKGAASKAARLGISFEDAIAAIKEAYKGGNGND